jgi:hypothetical protein
MGIVMASTAMTRSRNLLRHTADRAEANNALKGDRARMGRWITPCRLFDSKTTREVAPEVRDPSQNAVVEVLLG